MKLATLAVFASIYGCSVFPATAAEISTHVLDLARGTGGKGVPVALSKRSADGVWQQVAKSTTDANGRIRSFDDGGGRVRQRGVNSGVASGLHCQAALGVICSG